MSTDDRVDLVVTGMTCASCAQRIERKLNKLDGVIRGDARHRFLVADVEIVIVDRFVLEHRTNGPARQDRIIADQFRNIRVGD